ncbi:hypothetical protein [Pendulispora albinea]|uniref:Polysaccharide biosynthesis protein n=1 Tax=Pendulispora albinea TaxID=2741071 RepID=A0ABZ2LTY6_9BACT
MTALRGGTALIVANCLGLFFNYIHQAQAAALLPAESFGRFNVWLGLVGIGSSLAFLAQFAANFFIFPERAFAYWRVGSMALAIALAGVHLAVPGAPRPGVLAVESIVLGVLLNTTTGQYQARLRFGPMAFAAVTLFGTRALLPNIVSRPDEQTFYVATPIAFIVTLSALMIFRGGSKDVAPARSSTADAPTVRRRLGAALVLALCASVFPNLDVLGVAWIAPPETAGRFAQVVLFTRIPYLLGALLLQITLPYHVQGVDGARHGSSATFIHRLELIVMAGAAACAPLNALAVPWIARRLLGIDLEGQSWLILISSASFAALLVLFRGIQLSCSRSRLRLPIASLVFVLVFLLSARASSHGNAMTYLLVAVTAYASAAIGVHVFTRKRPPLAPSEDFQ